MTSINSTNLSNPFKIVQQVQIQSDHSQNLEDKLEIDNLSMKIEIENKSLCLNSPEKQIGNIDDIKPLSEIVIQSTHTSVVETPRDIEIESFDIGNPATWPLIINDTFRLFIVEQGPKLETYKNYNFPLDETDRHFHEKWFFRILPNGEEVRRQWLRYSKQKKCIVLFSLCSLFKR